MKEISMRLRNGKMRRDTPGEKYLPEFRFACNVLAANCLYSVCISTGESE
jgi:hypothetical protein